MRDDDHGDEEKKSQIKRHSASRKKDSFIHCLLLSWHNKQKKITDSYNGKMTELKPKPKSELDTVYCIQSQDLCFSFFFYGSHSPQYMHETRKNNTSV